MSHSTAAFQLTHVDHVLAGISPNAWLYESNYRSIDGLAERALHRITLYFASRVSDEIATRIADHIAKGPATCALAASDSLFHRSTPLGPAHMDWSPMKDFFLSPISSGNGPAPAVADLGQDESTMNQMAPEITWYLGDANLVSISSKVMLLLLLFGVLDLPTIWVGQEPLGRLVKTPLDQDRKLYDRNEFPDFVVLSRQAFDANPELASAWAQDHLDDGENGVLDWEQVAAIGVLGGMKKSDDTSEYECVFPATRLKHHLRMLAAESPIRSHTFGFTLEGSILTLYLHTPSGLFYSSDIECTEANGHLSTFIERLLSLNDLDLGKIASPGGPDGPPLPFPTAVLPPRVPSFARHLTKVPTMGSIEIEKTVFCSGEVLGLQKSASRVRAIRDEPGDNREYAMTVSFFEETFCDVHDRIRLAIASASPEDREGLTNFVDVYREVDFTLVPHFLKGDFDAEKCELKPRAMEVAFQERCLESIWTVDSTEALVRAVLGVVRGLRSLYRMRILHCDVSPGNIMIGPGGEGVLIDYDVAVFMDGPSGEAARLKRRGTFAFRPRHLIQYAGEILHQPWHDIEQLVYTLFCVVLARPKGPGDSTGMSDKAASVWEDWTMEGEAYLAFLSKETFVQVESNRTKLLDSSLEFWQGIPDLIATVAKYCGLGLSIVMYDKVAEEECLESGWGSGELSYDHLIADLEELLGKTAQKNREMVPTSPVIV
ncbi:BZ3500_MvSof-1268-A1-R1_Chr3-3g06579 [Microbotryum saponariae]|uniref:BZ3500_MvSof-1268-A1-R1_Chr3-3g06579 protein n=1 Tax=Microbotryum saponariae TaxID=289078 RepID=A0A2X0LGU3_9BASI|nr:BZ3500_MvSof-1268-A1-R1_Chr3-3g06579 [Microbotryum saponariae]SDA04546.1 BZ3501_MvSof-1269-A2-R1_Chr3-2g06266 [Microbotryum saponariae]